MTLLQAVVLGITEGITEFLPISSTGHLIIAGHLLQLPETDVLKSFEIAIQLGAILAAIVVYRTMIITHRRLWLTIGAAFIPTGIIGFLLHGIVKTYLLGNIAVVAAALGIGGIILIIVERLHDDAQSTITDVHGISVWQAFVIGTAQALAIIPGVSRSAATIVGGMALGIRRSAIVDFSFLLAIPTMAAATGFDLMKSAHLFSSDDVQALGVGFLVSFITAFAAIRWLLQYVRSHTFTAFGVYRLVLALVVLALIS